MLLTNLRPRNTLKPSTSSKIRSIILADTIHKSKIFHPHRKNSLESAMTFIKHSSVKTSVKTFKEREEIATEKGNILIKS